MFFKGLVLAFLSQYFGKETKCQGVPAHTYTNPTQLGYSESKDGYKSGRRQLPGERIHSHRKRGTFLVWAQVLLLPGFIPRNAKHQKATQKEPDLSKAQLR